MYAYISVKCTLLTFIHHVNLCNHTLRRCNMFRFYTAYVLTCEGRERFTGIYAFSEDHARSLAKALWGDVHGYDCPYRVSVRTDDLG